MVKGGLGKNVYLEQCTCNLVIDSLYMCYNDVLI